MPSAELADALQISEKADLPIEELPLLDLKEICELVNLNEAVVQTTLKLVVTNIAQILVKRPFQVIKI